MTISFGSLYEPIPEDAKRTLLNALLRLNGLSKNKAALSLGLFRSNLNSWLKGTNSSISSVKKLELLSLVGVSEGALDRRRIHRWDVKDIEDVRFALSVFLARDPAAELQIMNVCLANPADAVMRLTYGAESTYLLLHHHAPESIVPVINSSSLGLGVSVDSPVRLTKAQWGSWIQPDAVDRSTIARSIDGWLSLAAKKSNAHQSAQDDFSERQSNESRWLSVLDLALSSGLTFEQVIEGAERALGVESQKMGL